MCNGSLSYECSNGCYEEFLRRLDVKDMKDINGTLLLSRKEGENIIIEVGSEKIIINLVEATKGKAKIRVCASKSVKINREEIYKKENCIFTITR